MQTVFQKERSVRKTVTSQHGGKDVYEMSAVIITLLIGRNQTLVILTSSGRRRMQ